MRRVVRDYVLAALDRQQPDFERFLADRLEVTDAFPLDLRERVAEIREIDRPKITPRGGRRLSGDKNAELIRSESCVEREEYEDTTPLNFVQSDGTSKRTQMFVID